MAEITPIPSATVTLVRDCAGGLEVLMMQRNFNSGFVPGAFVFPGGALDDEDSTADAYALCAGLTDVEASRALGIARGGLAYWAAAIRESFEEAGLLIAYEAQGRMVALDQHEVAERFRLHRHALNAGERGLLDILRAENLMLAADQLVYFGHWITPVSAPRRYDTRFCVAHAPVGQEPVHDNEEMTESVWISPREAVERHLAGTFKLMTPTIHTLRQFAEYETADALLAGMRAIPDVPTIAPRIGKDGRRLLPGEPGFDELAAG